LGSPSSSGGVPGHSAAPQDGSRPGAGEIVCRRHFFEHFLWETRSLHYHAPHGCDRASTTLGQRPSSLGRLGRGPMPSSEAVFVQRKARRRKLAHKTERNPLKKLISRKEIDFDFLAKKLDFLAPGFGILAPGFEILAAGSGGSAASRPFGPGERARRRDKGRNLAPNACAPSKIAGALKGRRAAQPQALRASPAGPAPTMSCPFRQTSRRSWSCRRARSERSNKHS
jgi:hypothetical protein